MCLCSFCITLACSSYVTRICLQMPLSYTHPWRVQACYLWSRREKWAPLTQISVETFALCRKAALLRIKPPASLKHFIDTLRNLMVQSKNRATTKFIHGNKARILTIFVGRNFTCLEHVLCSCNNTSQIIFAWIKLEGEKRHKSMTIKLNFSLNCWFVCMIETCVNKERQPWPTAPEHNLLASSWSQILKQTPNAAS